MSNFHPAVREYNLLRNRLPVSPYDGSLSLAGVPTYRERREIHGADSADLLDSMCASWVMWAQPAGKVEEGPSGNLVDTGKPHLWATLLFTSFGRKYLAALAVLLFLLLPVPSFAAEPCRINVNTASPAQLALLINTGPALAGKIAAARTAGPLDAAKLDAVSGIGVKWLEYNGPHVAYSGPTTCETKLRKPAAVKPEAGTDGAQ